MASTDQNQLQIEINESAELNQALITNLEEWKISNELIEKSILEQQNLNLNLNENLNEWQLANNQIENQIINIQQENNCLQEKMSFIQTAHSSLVSFQNLIDEKQDLSNLNQISENLIKTQKQLIIKQDSSATEMLNQYENLTNLKQSLIEKLEKEIETQNVNNEKFKLISESNQIEKTLDELKEFNKVLTTNLDEWQNTNKNLEALILTEQNINGKLMENYSEWQDANIQLEALNNQELKKKLEEIELFKQEKETIVAELKFKITKLEAKIESQLNEIAFKNEEIDSLKSSLKSLADSCQSAASLADQINSLTWLKDDFQSKLQIKEKEIEEFKLSIENKDAEMNQNKIDYELNLKYKDENI